jgi:hypothetical protein
MIFLGILLVVTVTISASLRLAGFSKKSAVLFASIPWTVVNVLSLTSFVILRTPEGWVIPKTAQFFAGLILPITVALAAAFFVQKKEPILPPETTRGK